MTQEQADFRLIQLWISASEERASDEELAELNQIITTNQRSRRLIFDVSQHQGWLSWAGARSPGLALPALQSALSDSNLALDLDEELDLLSCSLQADEPGSDEGARCGEMLNTLAQREVDRPLPAYLVHMASWKMAFIAASLLIASYASMSLFSPTDTQGGVATIGVPDGSQYKAEVISSTPCLWNNSATPLVSLGRQYREGDTVTLLEGVAELRIASRSGEARVQLEGPAACVLGTEGIANLLYGKISFDNRDTSFGTFVVETSFGRVLVNPGADIGISTLGNVAEIHVFHGSAALDSPWLVSDSGELTSRAIETRKAIRITQDDNSVYQFTNTVADRSQFTPEISNRGNLLEVTERYVRHVMDAKPVAYWRFDGSENREVRNEMSDSFHGKLLGDYRWVGTGQSQAIEFGVLPHPGMMRVYDSWDETLKSDFAIELWMKPSHFHHGTLISLAGPFNRNSKKNPLGIAVETMGGWGDGAKTNRLRFLVREPLGYYADSSAYSGNLYLPRYWQHVVTQRHGNKFETYLDGELVQSQEGETKSPEGLTLIVGKLYTDELYRPFFGMMDELAVYNRALDEAEVVQHKKAIQINRSASDVY